MRARRSGEPDSGFHAFGHHEKVAAMKSLFACMVAHASYASWRGAPELLMSPMLHLATCAVPTQRDARA